MRCSNGEGWYGALIRRLVVEKGIDDVERPRLERWRAWRGGALFAGAPGQQRGWVPASAIPDDVVERVARVRSLCRHRRSLDEVALRLAFTDDVAPVALEAVRRERPELWQRIEDELVEAEVEVNGSGGSGVGLRETKSLRDAAWPYVPRLATTSRGRLELRLPPIDPRLQAEWPDNAASLGLHDKLGEAIIVGRSWRSPYPDHFEQQGECDVCHETVYVNVAQDESPRSRRRVKEAAVVCERCAGRYPPAMTMPLLTARSSAATSPAA